MEWIIGLIVLVLVVVVKSVFVKSRADKGYKYRQRGPLFTPAELSFLGVLDPEVSDNYRVFGNVSVAAILNPAKGMGRKGWQIAFNKISSKHFDYVLCSKDNLEVIAVIEIDNNSHNTEKAKNRDSLLENACKSAELKLVRFQAKSGYQVQTVREQIDFVLNPP